MRSIADILEERFRGDGAAWTLMVTFHDDSQVELAVSEVLADGVVGQAIGHREFAGMWAYSSMAHIRILEEGDS